jgi:hypothetical protein
MPPSSKKLEPKIVEMPSQKMAVVTGRGSPDEVFARLMPALYGSAYTLKFDLKKKGLPTFKVTGLRARYPDIPGTAKEQWTQIIGLPVPDDTTSLPQKLPEIQVKLETWKYGTVAEILHLGSYAEETANIERLHKFIEDSGYEISGPHEEEYLTMPDAKVPKTIIRYEVKKKK